MDAAGRGVYGQVQTRMHMGHVMATIGLRVQPKIQFFVLLNFQRPAVGMVVSVVCEVRVTPAYVTRPHVL